MLVARLVAAGVTLAIVIAAPASGAPPWSGATPLGPPGYVPAGLDFTTTGTGVLALSSVSGGPLLAAPVRSTGPTATAQFGAAGDRLQFQNVGRGQQIAAFGRNDVVATGTTTTASGAPWVAFGRIGHRLGRHQAIPDTTGSAVLAANSQGDVAVASVKCESCPLELRYRPHDGRLSPPRRVAASAFDQGDFASGVAPAIAINNDGDVLVAWGRGTFPAPHPLYARIWSGGRWRGPAKQIGELLETGEITARIAADGRAVVGWWTQHADTGGAGAGPFAPPTFHAALAGRDGRFTAGRQLDQGATGPGPIPQAPQYLPSSPRLLTTIEAAGTARLAWTGADSSGPLVRSVLFVRGRMTPVQTLGRGSLEGLTLDGDDHPVLLWSDNTQVLASSGALGQPFGAPEIVAAAPDVIAGHGELAWNPRTGALLAAWVTGTSNTASWQVRWAMRPSGSAAPPPPRQTPASGS